MRIETVDESFFAWLAGGDFAFQVERVFEAAFDVPVAGRLRAVAPYRKAYGLDLQAFRDARAAEDRALFAARGPRGWAGYLLASEHWNGYGAVDELGVEAGQRRQGAARVLMDAAVAWARARGLAGLTLETQDTNVPACLFYQRYGFELGGIDRLLYSAQGELAGETALFWYLRFAAPARAWNAARGPLPTAERPQQ